MAHSDQPLKEGRVHISAPHMYGAAIQALDLVPNSSISFLNVGSGTGYITLLKSLDRTVSIMVCSRSVSNLHVIKNKSLTTSFHIKQVLSCTMM